MYKKKEEKKRLFSFVQQVFSSVSESLNLFFFKKIIIKLIINYLKIRLIVEELIKKLKIKLGLFSLGIWRTKNKVALYFLKLGRSLTPDKSTGEFSFSRFIKVLYKCQHSLLE